MIYYNISHKNYDESISVLAEALKDPTHIDCCIDFDADHSNSKIIRDFVGMIFDHHFINHPWKGRFVLITDELINNAIEHGSIAGDIDHCIVQAGTRDDGEFYIVLEVHDTGNGKDAKDATHMEQIRSDKLKPNEQGVYMNMRGRGLFHITEKLVDRLTFSESPKGGLAVKIEKNITPGNKATITITPANTDKTEHEVKEVL